MTDCEKDALVATKIMGWHVVPETPRNKKAWVKLGGRRRFPVDEFKPTASLDACAIAEQKIGKLGLKAAYAVELVILAVKADSGKDTRWYDVATAPPGVRVDAMLECVKGDG